MILCRRCGQSIFINDDQFIEYASISGTETKYLNPRTGEVDDYGDTNTEGDGSSDYECPNCGGSRIDLEWDFEDEVEAQKFSEALRESYNLVRGQQKQEELRKIEEAHAWDK